MESMVLAVLVGILALMGIGSIMSAIHLSFYGANDDACEYIILPVKGHMEDIEFRIRGAMARRRKVGNHISKIYLTDFGADAETAEIAKRMCSEFEILEWVDSFELTKDISDELRLQK